MKGWIDASSGASGDMLLGALVDVGVPTGVLQDAIDAVSPEPVQLTTRRVSRRGLVATQCLVDAPVSQVSRSWSHICAILHDSALRDSVRDRALATFERLAEAEGTVHGISPSEVHFHEVGSLDAIADVVGVCAGLDYLALEQLVVSPVAVGSGRVQGEHGSLPVPPPAVAELLRGCPSLAGVGSHEMCTPTGAALLTSQASRFGGQPAMTVHRIGSGAGTRDPESHANILRLMIGEPVAQPVLGDPLLVIEANVDDMDPRLWPDLIATLLREGAVDAWLTPILMKKGRPAHTLSALVSEDRAGPVRSTIFSHTSTIGMREWPVGRHTLPRETYVVEVHGHQVRVKLSSNHGTVVNAQPEYDDVVAVAHATGRAPKQVLAAAITAAQTARPPVRSHDSERGALQVSEPPGA